MNENILLNFNWNIKELDNKQLQNIAFAHWVQDKRNWDYKKAFWKYPNAYKVTDIQIQEAQEELNKRKQEELNKRKQEELKKYKNKLVFVNMWLEFKSETWYIWNHRIRSRFKNKDNDICFLEVWTNNYMNSRKDNKELICDFAINKTRDPKNNYNYNNIYNKINCIKDWKITNNNYYEYTKENLLKIVNYYFNCNYKKIYFTDILTPQEIKNNL